ncbi:MAG: TMEM43 family protein [Bacteroidales bacterium]|nr:TMEM43 family protein [Bacteroidales bacterium]MBR1571016.1 TMEM43 family protein [Bacteroidales bacterium]
MAYTETTRTSYGKRLGNSLGGIVTGLLLFVVGTVLIWYNEGRAVKTDKLLKEAQGQVVEMPDISTADPSFEGKLIHATGLATTTDSLSDSQFKVGARAIALRRAVEYYQWVESSESTSKDKFGGAEETTTTYTYDLQWVSSPISSKEFHDPDYRNENTVKQQVEAYTKYAQNVRFGAYRLNSDQIRSMSGSVPVEVDDSTHTNVIYIGEDPSRPDVGDVRITFTKVMPGEVSIVAAVSGDTFAPYQAKSGKTFSALRMGNVPQEQIFESEHATNKMILWLLRIVGFFLILAGLRNIFSILETLLKVIPFLSRIVGWGISVVCGVVAFAWTLVVAALAWIAYRPVVAIVLLVIAAAVIWYFSTHGKKNAPEPPATPQAPAGA